MNPPNNPVHIATNPVPNDHDKSRSALLNEAYRQILLSEFRQIIEELQSKPAHMFITREQLDAEIDELIRKRPFKSFSKK